LFAGRTNSTTRRQLSCSEIGIHTLGMWENWWEKEGGTAQTLTLLEPIEHRLELASSHLIRGAVEAVDALSQLRQACDLLLRTPTEERRPDYSRLL